MRLARGFFQAEHPAAQCYIFALHVQQLFPQIRHLGHRQFIIQIERHAAPQVLLRHIADIHQLAHDPFKIHLLARSILQQHSVRVFIHRGNGRKFGMYRKSFSGNVVQRHSKQLLFPVVCSRLPPQDMDQHQVAVPITAGENPQPLQGFDIPFVVLAAQKRADCLGCDGLRLLVERAAHLG